MSIAIFVSACDLRGAKGASIDETRMLESTFGVLQSMRVDTYSDQDWCKVLKYLRGGFMQTTSPPNCYIASASEARTFDDQARADFDHVASAFRNVGFRPYSADMTFDAGGRLVRADFELGCAGCEFGTYFYDASGRFEGDGDAFYVQVNEHWQWSDG